MTKLHEKTVKDSNESGVFSNLGSKTCIDIISETTTCETMTHEFNICEIVNSPNVTSDVKEDYSSSHSADLILNESVIHDSTLTDVRLEVSDKWSLDDLVREVILPSNQWVWQVNLVDNLLICSNHKETLANTMNVKTVNVLANGEVVFFVNGKRAQLNTVEQRFSTPHDLSVIVSTFDSLNICEAIDNKALKFDLTKRCGGYFDGQVLRSHQCTMLAASSLICMKCISFKKNIFKRRRTHSITTKNSIIKQKLQTQQRTIKRIKKHGTIVSGMVTSLQRRKRNVNKIDKINDFDRKLKNLSPTVIHSFFTL